MFAAAYGFVKLSSTARTTDAIVTSSATGAIQASSASFITALFVVVGLVAFATMILILRYKSGDDPDLRRLVARLVLNSLMTVVTVTALAAVAIYFIVVHNLRRVRAATTDFFSGRRVRPVRLSTSIQQI
jgi:heme/copper-type cytochrome/quinol oxidase subunit 2